MQNFGIYCSARYTETMTYVELRISLTDHSNATDSDSSVNQSTMNQSTIIDEKLPANTAP